MANNLGQFERERFESGEAAGDKKGDLARIHSLKAERIATILFSWLSGGASEVTLPQSLPIARGGTGATSVDSAIRNLGYFEDVNHVLRRGIKVITVSNTVAVDRFKNATGVTWARTATGTYVFKGAKLANNLWGVVVPISYLGVPKYVVESSVSGDTTTIKVYTAVLTNGVYAKGVLTDIVANQYIDLELE